METFSFFYSNPKQQKKIKKTKTKTETETNENDTFRLSKRPNVENTKRKCNFKKKKKDKYFRVNQRKQSVKNCENNPLKFSQR